MGTRFRDPPGTVGRAFCKSSSSVGTPRGLLAARRDTAFSRAAAHEVPALVPAPPELAMRSLRVIPELDEPLLPTRSTALCGEGNTPTRSWNHWRSEDLVAGSVFAIVVARALAPAAHAAVFLPPPLQALTLPGPVPRLGPRLPGLSSSRGPTDPLAPLGSTDSSSSIPTSSRTASGRNLTLLSPCSAEDQTSVRDLSTFGGVLATGRATAFVPPAGVAFRALPRGLARGFARSPMSSGRWACSRASRPCKGGSSFFPYLSAIRALRALWIPSMRGGRHDQPGRRANSA